MNDISVVVPYRDRATHLEQFVPAIIKAIPGVELLIVSPQNGATHLATAASQFEYKMPYLQYFGGVTMFDRGSFAECNGFPANYYGWGLEDDALLDRVHLAGIDVFRRNDQRFLSLDHERPYGNNPPKENIDIHFKALGSKEAVLRNGLTTMSYTLQSVTKQEGYTHILVDI